MTDDPYTLFMATELHGEVSHDPGGRYEIRIGAEGAYFYDTLDGKQLSIEEAADLIKQET
jgi:hypothetical protein